jgi:hypothetical protein
MLQFGIKVLQYERVLQLGKRSYYPEVGKVSRGAHGKESMNFCQGEYDVGASLVREQRHDHSTHESSSRTSTWEVTTDFRICLHSASELTFGGTLEPVSNFTL